MSTDDEARALDLIEQQLANGYTETDAEITVHYQLDGYVQATVYDDGRAIDVRIYVEATT